MATLAVLLIAVTFSMSTRAAPVCKAIKAVGGAVQPRGCVTRGDIAKAAIDGRSIKDRSVAAADLATGSVGTSELVNGAVTGAKIVNESLTAADLAANSVGSSEIAANAVGASELAADSIGASEVGNDSLTASDFAHEAGAVFAGGNQEQALTVQGAVVRSVTLNAPSAGVALVTASGYFRLKEVTDTDLDSAWCEIVPVGLSYSTQSAAVSEPDAIAEIAFWPFMLSRSFELTAGAQTFDLECTQASGDVDIADSSLTVIFTPTRY